MKVHGRSVPKERAPTEADARNNKSTAIVKYLRAFDLGENRMGDYLCRDFYSWHSVL